MDCGCGRRHWGLAGAAGLLVWEPGRVLLQLRAEWTHGGGTWSLPGGAIQPGEDVIAAALRESEEEAGIVDADVTPWHLAVSRHPDWSYTTVVAGGAAGLSPRAANSESERIAWVRPDDVEGLPLHPAFAEAWPRLRTLLTEPAVVVDAANVVGSRPDGWWKDRAGAAARLVADLAARPWWPGAELGFGSESVRPTVHVVLEGQARAGAAAGTDGSVVVHHAPREGDDAIAALATSLAGAEREIVVVTSDRGLRARVQGAARCVGAGALAAGRRDDHTPRPRTLEP